MCFRGGSREPRWEATPLCFTCFLCLLPKQLLIWGKFACDHGSICMRSSREGKRTCHISPTRVCSHQEQGRCQQWPWPSPAVAAELKSFSSGHTSLPPYELTSPRGERISCHQRSLPARPPRGTAGGIVSCLRYRFLRPCSRTTASSPRRVRTGELGPTVTKQASWKEAGRGRGGRPTVKLGQRFPRGAEQDST